jgi:N-acetylglucosamine kinase-like BadF-type ATPase
MGEIYIGIDGGGSKTAFCAVDEGGKVLSTALEGGSSIDTVKKEETAICLYKGIEDLKISGKIRGIGCFLGGVISKEDKAEVASLLSKAEGVTSQTELLVDNDAYNAFRSAFKEEGIVFIVGTGSLGVGCNKEGIFLRVGGYGYHEGDKGSGYYLGHEALLVLARYMDKRKHKEKLEEELMNKLNISSKEELIRVFNTYSRSEVASLAPLVVQTKDCSSSKKILQKGAEEFASIGKNISSRLKLKDSCYSVIGGIGTKTAYLDFIKDAMKKALPGFRYVKAALKPETAAAYLIKEFVQE